MDQEEGAGHHAITREAVRELFEARGNPVQIDGMTQQQYYEALDHAQEHQDRWWGPTTHPGSLDGAAQRQHAMADPSQSGAWNVHTDEQYIAGELGLAHQDAASASARQDEISHLGAAAHALEDSYSEAHMWRGDAVHSGDQTAHIQSINDFEPATGQGLEGTHDPYFDHVPVGPHGELLRGSDQAAAHAVAHMLETYEATRHASMGQAVDAYHQELDPDFQMDPGVHVNSDSYDPAYESEHDRRVDTSASQSHGDVHPEHGHHWVGTEPPSQYDIADDPIDGAF